MGKGGTVCVEIAALLRRSIFLPFNDQRYVPRTAEQAPNKYRLNRTYVHNPRFIIK